MKIKIVFSALILFFLVSNQTHAQWTACEGLDGIGVGDLEIYDSVIYLCGSSNIYTKHIHNDVWNNLVSSTLILNIEKADSVLFGMNFSSLERSYDMGKSWEYISGGYFEYNPENFSTIKNNVIIANFDSIFISNDYGDSWTNINNGLPQLEFVFFCTSDTTIYIGDNYIDTIFWSDDLGFTWSPITRMGLPEDIGRNIYEIVTFNDSLWAATKNGVFVYGGENEGWFSRNSGLPLDFIFDLDIFNDTLYCAGRKGIYLLYNGSWGPLNEGLETNFVRSLISYDNKQYAGSDWGPFIRSTGEAWSPIYYGVNHLQINSVTVFSDEIFALTKKGIFKSNDKGNSFELLNSGSYTNSFYMIPTDSLFYLLCDSGFLISEDYGATWFEKNDGFGLYNPQCLAISKYYCYVGTGQGLYRSYHNEFVWNKVSDLPEKSNIRNIVVIDSLVTLTADSYTCTSQNHAEHFDTVLNLSGGLRKYENKIYGLHFVDKLIISINGYQWDDYLLPVDNYWNCNELYANDEAIVLGGMKNIYDGCFVLISYDGGYLWQDVSSDLPSNLFSSIYSVAIYDNRIFAAPYRNSLWYRDDLLVGNREEKIVDQTEIMVYPNPVTNKVTIELGSSFQKQNLIKLYDLNGNLVKEINNFSTKQQIDLSDLSSGFYFLQVIDDSKVASKKLIKQ